MRAASNGTRGRLRVAHLITRLELGGAQLNTLHTCRNLPADRFEVHLVTGPGGILDSRARENTEYRVHFVPGLGRKLNPVNDLLALFRLIACLRRIDPDVVHTHSSKAGILGRWAAWFAGVPVRVHTFHGFGFHDAQAPLYRRLLVQAERWTARITTYVLAVSMETLKAGERERVLDPARAECLHSGVDLESLRGIRADRRKLLEWIGAAGDPPLVGMVACLKPQKNPVDFLRVAERVLPEMPDARFLVIGDGHLRRQMERQIHKRGLMGRVHLLGWRRDVAEIVAALDLLVLTSRWEGLPRVFAEARAVGVPIVATRVGGAVEAIRDGSSGFLVEPGDVQGMARHVLRLLRDPYLRRELARQARLGLEEFDIRSMVDRQEKLYLELADRRPVAVPAAVG